MCGQRPNGFTLPWWTASGRYSRAAALSLPRCRNRRLGECSNTLPSEGPRRCEEQTVHRAVHQFGSRSGHQECICEYPVVRDTGQLNTSSSIRSCEKTTHISIVTARLTPHRKARTCRSGHVELARLINTGGHRARFVEIVWVESIAV